MIKEAEKNKKTFSKKAVIALYSILFCSVALLPLGFLLSSLFGRSFELSDYPVFAILTAFLSVSSVISSVVSGNDFKSKTTEILLSLSAPLSLINAVLYIIECRKISVVASVFICFVFCFFLAVKHSKPLALKIIALTLSGLMVLPACFFTFISLTVGNIGQNTVIQSVESPNGKYHAEVIDSDQGALGGNTVVNIYKNDDIDLFAFKIKTKPHTVYCGKYGEYRDMQIYWKNDNCLIINSAEYEINQ